MKLLVFIVWSTLIGDKLYYIIDYIKPEIYNISAEVILSDIQKL
jgi:hypothetical protein